MITLRKDLALNLEAGFDNYLEEIATAYGDYLAPALEEGETAPDVRFQLVLLRRSVERQRKRIASFDGGVLEQTHDDEKVRAELAKRRDDVDAKLRLVRHVCRGVYGLKNLGRVGLAGDFPRGVVRLHQFAETVKTSLENPDLGLEPQLVIESAGDDAINTSAQLAAQLDPELSDLGDLINTRHRERRRATNVRLRRQQVIREFDDEIRGIVRLTQGMFRLAGRNDLGTRFRPILRRTLRKLQDGENQATPQAETDSEAASANATEAPADTAPKAPEVEPKTTDETSTSESTNA
ncbi:MAG: hypothetical protein AAF657_35950 [Acidobacteriota bacterium]